MALTPDDQLIAIEAAERVSSVFSVLGALLIIVTFLYDNRFRKPINRLVFYASWGNLFANVATLISREGISQGINLPLCQFQAFLIQWFMPADALFTFAMACNVYLTFFKQHDAAALRKLEWRYLALCYGLPFIPAVTFLFVDTADRGKIYGSANLWCWISLKWNALRIASFYGPVWIIILFDMFIYVKVGLIVFRWRNSLVSSGVRTISPGPDQALKERPKYEFNVVSQVPHARTRSMGSLKRPLSIQGPLPYHSRHGSDQRMSDQSIQVNTTVSYQPGTVRDLPRAIDANRATLQYCYTACLFSFALIVTWVPSTVNRLYTLINNQPSPFGLDLSSALVLPLQGFWNTIIYIVTSWAACKALWHENITACCCGLNRRAPSITVSGHKLQPLGSADFHQPRQSQPKDPYPLSPVSSHRWSNNDGETYPRSSPPQPPHRPRRSGTFDFELNDDNHTERADIVMSLDSRGRIVRRGRNQFDWGTPTASGPAVRSSSSLGMRPTSPAITEEISTSQRSPSAAGFQQGGLHVHRSNSQLSYRSRDGLVATTPQQLYRSHSATGIRGTGVLGGYPPTRSNSQISYRSRDGYVVPPHSRRGSGHIVEQMQEARI